MTVDKEQAVLQYMEVTGLTSEELAKQALRAAEWNLERAVQSFFTDGPPTAAAAAPQPGAAPRWGSGDFSPDNTPGGLRRRMREAADGGGGSGAGPTAGPAVDVDPAPNGQGGPELGWGEWLTELLTYPFQLVGSIGTGLFHIVWAFFRSFAPGGVAFGMPPHGEMTKLLQQSGLVTPTSRVEGNLLEAANAAKRELKFLLLVLHSPGNPDSERFLRETYADPDFAAFVGSNLLVWAEADTDVRGAKMCSDLRVRSMPHLAIVTLVNGQMQIVWQHGGFIAATPLLEKLIEIMEVYQAALTAEQAERTQRDMDRLIREQQEEEFEASLQADREKQAKKQAEADAIAAAAAAEEARIQSELDAADARQRDLEAKRAALPPPPAAGFSGPVARLRFKFPNGQQTDRSFPIESTTVAQLYDYVDVQDCGVSPDFSLFRNAPRRVEILAGGSLAEDPGRVREQTLAEAGFVAGNERIMVQDNAV